MLFRDTEAAREPALEVFRQAKEVWRALAPER
jgi:hypothetical protein